MWTPGRRRLINILLQNSVELLHKDSDKDYIPSGFTDNSESGMVSSEPATPLSNVDCQESYIVKDSLPKDKFCTAQLKIFLVGNLEAEDTT